MQKIHFRIACLCLITCPVLLLAQVLPRDLSAGDTLLEAVPIQETVISAQRANQNRSAVAQQINVIGLAQISSLNAQSSADLIQNSGAAFVQKSQQGGGSPVLRGFEASRVLLVVDGVRMNNAIYRAGHLQNITTMDNATLERVEVLYGPGSTVYGTDALGGVIAFFTKNPQLATAQQTFKTTGTAFVRYGSANQENTGHLDFSLAGKHFGSLTSLTFSDFGDLRMGGKAGSKGEFGLRPFYAQRFNGRDSLVRNEDPLVQRASGYTQYDVLQKFLYSKGRNAHLVNLQFSNSSDIPRYDRLTEGSNGQLDFAEWYYGPQERLMAAYQYSRQGLGWFDRLDLTASYQNIEESRSSRRFGNAVRTDRVEQVDVVGLLIQLQKAWNNQVLRTGLDVQHNTVTSTAQRVHVDLGTVAPQSTRYPDGGSSMTNAALFVTHEWTKGANWRFSEGVRGGYSRLDATFRDKTFFPFPFDAVQQQAPVWSGNLGAIYTPSAYWRWGINASSGFRMPNVDDLGKVFDTQKGSLIVPNPDLGPEQTYNLELNLIHTIAGRFRWENVVWGTSFRNAIVTDTYQFGGQDSIVYDGVLSRVLANQNKRTARLWGFSSILQADITNKWAMYGSFNYTRGRIIESEGTSPLDHIPPIYGKAGLRWHTSKGNVEAFALFNGAKPESAYNKEGEDNFQYATPEGLPAWTTFNLRGSWSLWRGLKVQAGIDNILDLQYRTFASGFSASGRNVWVTVRYVW